MDGLEGTSTKPLKHRTNINHSAYMPLSLRNMGFSFYMLIQTIATKKNQKDPWATIAVGNILSEGLKQTLSF